MSDKIVNGYPDYLIRVDASAMRLLINREFLADAQAKGSQPVEGEESDEWLWVAFPGKYEVCDNCHGKGSHVDCAIDGNGLSQEDFDEDPDFREAYMSGAYDVTCDVCGGLRVMLVPASEQGEKAVEAVLKGYYDIRAEEAAERRMGC